MSRFVHLDCSYVNIDTISYVEPAFRTYEKCIVHFKDGTSAKSSHYDEAQILGEDHVVQILPCIEPVTAIYEDGDSDGAVCEQDVFYLGLCADSSIKPIVLLGGYYDVIDTVNFKGLRAKEESWRKVEGERLDRVCLEFGIKRKGE